MRLLDECDALLDIHSSNSDHATPFVICEENAFPIVRTFDFPIISTGWDAIEPGGSDGYIFRTGKIGICAECGSVSDTAAGLPFAEQAIRAFLHHFDMLSDDGTFPVRTHRHIHVHTVGMKRTESFRFDKHYRDFEMLETGKPFAWDGDTTYTAAENDCIIFPRANTPIGEEAFILGKDLPSPTWV